jgi:putative NADH-flavin reductase
LLRISAEDFAIALVDEAESGAHIGDRFTVGY